MSEWQPIETAPRDGTDILVLLYEGVFQARYDGSSWSFPVAKYHGCGCCGYDGDQPTHWQTLPPPPTT